jgi:O-antigen/teichoic acid export membrane protein
MAYKPHDPRSRLGPAGYGGYTLAATIVFWLESILVMLFDRVTVKLVGESDDWRPVASTALRLNLLVSGGAALLLMALAGPIAAGLNEPPLAVYLRLFALDIPLASLSQAHRAFLAGVGCFRRRALAVAGRWTGKLILTLILVGLGLSIEGAIWANIGASAIELAVGRFFIRPSFFAPGRLPYRVFLGSALPLFAMSMALRIFDKMGVVALKALGGSVENVGFFTAAQNMAFFPGILSLGFNPLLLSTLSRTLGAGDEAKSREFARHSLRLMFWLMPFLTIITVMAPGLVRLALGRAYAPAAPAFVWLMWSNAIMFGYVTASTILVAAGKTSWTIAVAWPLPALALAGYVYAVPAKGFVGAAAVNAGVSVLGLVMILIAVRRLWAIVPPVGTVLRSAAISGAILGVHHYYPFREFNLLTGVAVACGGTIGLFLLLGEFTHEELAMLRSLLPGRRGPKISAGSAP